MNRNFYKIIGDFSPLGRSKVKTESLASFDEQEHRGDKGRGETEGVSQSSQLERTPQLLVTVILSPPGAVSKQNFYAWNVNIKFR